MQNELSTHISHGQARSGGTLAVVIHESSNAVALDRLESNQLQRRGNRTATLDLTQHTAQRFNAVARWWRQARRWRQHYRRRQRACRENSCEAVDTLFTYSGSISSMRSLGGRRQTALPRQATRHIVFIGRRRNRRSRWAVVSTFLELHTTSTYSRGISSIGGVGGGRRTAPLRQAARHLVFIGGVAAQPTAASPS